MNNNKAELKNHIRKEQARILFSLSRNALLTTFLVGIFALLVLSPIFQMKNLTIWFSALSIIIAIRFIITLLYEKIGIERVKSITWIRLFAIGSTLTGLMWGIASTIFFPIEYPKYQPMVCIMVVGMTAGAVPFLSSVPLIYILFSLPALLPFAFYMIYLGDNTFTLLGVSTLLYVFMNVVSSLRIGNTISSNIKMSIERGLLIEDMEKAKKDAEKANNAKSVFISSISHELRTPLNAILGYSQLLSNSSEDLNSEIEDGLNEINNAGTHLLDLIDDVLDLSKIEADLLKLDIKAINISSVINKCMAIINPNIQKEGIKLEIINSSQSDLYINADEAKFRQIILNILSNAIKYNSRRGRITIFISLNQNKKVKIAITDTGQGIAPQNMDKIFTPFDRLGTESTIVPGTGLGLTISKKLVNLMNGEIDVTSQEGVGTTFTLLFPAVESEIPKSADTAIINVEQAIKDTKKTYSILYIEDNETNIKLLAKILKKFRPSVKFFSATTGYEGISFAKELEPDIILCDIQLPDISGFEIARELRNFPQFKNVSIIALSAEANKEIIEKSLEAGFNSYQTKPFQISNLLNTLDKDSKNT